MFPLLFIIGRILDSDQAAAFCNSAALLSTDWANYFQNNSNWEQLFMVYSRNVSFCKNQQKTSVFIIFCKNNVNISVLQFVLQKNKLFMVYSCRNVSFLQKSTKNFSFRNFFLQKQCKYFCFAICFAKNIFSPEVLCAANKIFHSMSRLSYILKRILNFVST
jgi:hypothetical protein